MNETIYILGQAIIVLIVAGLVFSIYRGSDYALRKLRLRKYKREELLKAFILIIILWLAILATLSFLNFFQDFQTLPPKILVAVLPPLVLVVTLMFSRLFKFILLVIPFSWFIYIQSFRILMEIFLWLGYLGGYVPPQMTFEWLNYDIMVGLTAMMAGYVFFGHGRYRRSEAIIWNIFGVVLLVNILLISFLSAPSPFQVFKIEPSNRFIADFPFIWIPGFIVPFALAMHLFSLKQLYINKGNRRQFRFRRPTK